MVTAIEFAMEASKVGIQLTPEERFEVFGDFDPDALRRGGGAALGRHRRVPESARRTSRYTKADWQRIKAESEDWGRRFVGGDGLGRAGRRARQAMELAEEHRQQISRWFYECTYEIHTGLADMYLADDAVHRVLRDHQAGHGAVPARRHPRQRDHPGLNDRNARGRRTAPCPRTSTRS